MLLFKLKNISCQYPGENKEVLLINDLEIKKGKLTFIVGESGIGKSTLLETLGMMNNTIKKSDSLTFKFFPPEGEANLIRYWDRANSSLLNDLRNDHFSFVFQNNNLMDSLSAEENVWLSSLIQGKKIEEARQKTNLSFDTFNISNLKHKSTKKLSGGEKQRVAFARAFSKDFVVLFGDEPTGNLDPVNADNVFIELREAIKNSMNKKGAIIVSHDIERTIEFADEIIVITSIGIKENKIGVINSENVYTSEIENSKKWTNTLGTVFSNENMKKLLIKVMSNSSKNE